MESAWDAGECERVSAELAESERAGAELLQERDELSSRGSALEAELEGTRQALPRMSCPAAARSGCHVLQERGEPALMYPQRGLGCQWG